MAFQSGGWREARRERGWRLPGNVDAPNATEIHLKMVEMVNFMLCIFNHNKNNWEKSLYLEKKVSTCKYCQIIKIQFFPGLKKMARV